jgi:hypothetical protein
VDDRAKPGHDAWGERGRVNVGRQLLPRRHARLGPRIYDFDNFDQVIQTQRAKSFAPPFHVILSQK